MINRRTFIQGASTLMLGAGLLPLAGARAETLGGRLLYGYPAGAIGDQLAHGVLPLLGAQDGPQYNLVNVEGRNTRMATMQAKAAPATGGTLLQILSSSFTLQPHIYKQVDFDPLKDFEPIALFGDLTYSLTVGPVVPASVTDLRSLLAWLHDNPEYRSIGVTVYGTLGHLALRMLARNSDVTLRGQPYKGAKAMLADLDNQSLAVAFSLTGDVSGTGGHPHPHLRSIGVTSRQRLKYWPQVPTLYEQGFTDLDITTWVGWFAPAGTPQAITSLLRERVGAVQASKQYQTLQEQLMMTPNSSADPARIHALITEESTRFAGLLTTYKVAKLD